jgi:hypothetical protein
VPPSQNELSRVLCQLRHVLAVTCTKSQSDPVKMDPDKGCFSGQRSSTQDWLASREELHCTADDDNTQAGLLPTLIWLFVLLRCYCSELSNMQVIFADHVELLDDWFTKPLCGAGEMA